MKIVVIESGSKGNATLIIDKGRVLLIDMGITLCSLKEALQEENLNVYNIEALLLTHEHSDHTKGISYLPPVPIFCTKETYDSPSVNPITPYESFYIGHLEITPVSTSHDVKNPIGFVIKNNEEKLVYLTDSGKITVKTLAKLKNADYYVFESNHDIDMLLATNRPMWLKKRILSNKGHLNNEQSATYLTKLVGDKTKQIILAHLSEEANDPNLTIETHRRVFKEANVSLENIEILCASQHERVYGGKNELRRI